MALMRKTNRAKLPPQILGLAMFALCSISQAQTSAQDHFSFGGFALQTSIKEIKAGFPNSSIEDGERMLYVRVHPSDVRDQVTTGYYHINKNKRTSLTLLFERNPVPPKDGNFAQNPSCESVMRPLIKAYGKPIGPLGGSEEGVTIDDYVWEMPTEKLVLVCSHPVSNKKKQSWVSYISIGPSQGGYCKNQSCF